MSQELVSNSPSEIPAIGSIIYHRNETGERIYEVWDGRQWLVVARTILEGTSIGTATMSITVGNDQPTPEEFPNYVEFEDIHHYSGFCIPNLFNDCNYDFETWALTSIYRERIMAARYWFRKRGGLKALLATPCPHSPSGQWYERGLVGANNAPVAMASQIKTMLRRGEI